MLISDFHYDLPEELIAQEPLADRATSRMLHLHRSSGHYEDRSFRELPDLLRPSDLVVLNNTRVFPARLYGRRAGLKSKVLSPGSPATRDFLQGRIEVLLTCPVADPAPGTSNDWDCLVRPGRKIAVGERLFFGENDELTAEVIARSGFGERRIRFDPVDDFMSKLEAIGHIPLPPYISRPDSSHDRERYQTVYAQERGSVAAPTAGLHFTPGILARIKERGIEIANITLHVGLGTFQPVRVDRVEEHRLHTERYSISPEAAASINQALAQSRRVVAIGTTTVRALEHASQQGSRKIQAGAAEADIFIYPGYSFQAAGALLTNFHLPQSTLLMLVSALGGRENVLHAYAHAVSELYRFYSYGDCMFVE